VEVALRGWGRRGRWCGGVGACVGVGARMHGFSMGDGSVWRREKHENRRQFICRIVYARRNSNVVGGCLEM
jgi:hypothetical protein